MNGPYLKIVAYFSMAFGWLWLANITLVWLTCRREWTKPAYHFIFISHAIACFPGLFFALKGFETLQHISSLPRGERLIIGISLVIMTFAVSMLGSVFSIKYFSPGKWEKFSKIRDTSFHKNMIPPVKTASPSMTAITPSDKRRKIMNSRRWRFLAIVAAINIGVFALGYLTLPADKRSGLVVVMLALLPVGLIGLGMIIALWRRYPATDEKDKKD